MSGPDKYGLPPLKAEALCAELLQNGLSFEKTVYKSLGSFRQSYRPDVESIPSDFDDIDGITIAVNRDGLYDRLPEGLFHQTRGNSKTMSVSEMVGEYKRYRDEERHARKFFAPLEQEFFRYGVMIEQEERNLWQGIFNETLHRILYQFWDLDPSIPPQAASVLMRIMPWASRIKGDTILTAKSLELMLQKRVTLTTGSDNRIYYSAQTSGLGEHRLGIDMMVGQSMHDTCVSWHFTIHDLDDEAIADYREGMSIGNFLNRFRELLIPVEIDAFFDFELTADNHTNTEKILGYSLTI